MVTLIGIKNKENKTMNILFKIFFIAIFFLIANKPSELLGMQRVHINNDWEFQSRVLYQYNDGGTKGIMIKYERPRIKFLGITWIKHTYQRKYTMRPFRPDLCSEKKLHENSFELCGKTKVLLGGSLLGLGLIGLRLIFEY